MFFCNNSVAAVGWKSKANTRFKNGKYDKTRTIDVKFNARMVEKFG